MWKSSLETRQKICNITPIVFEFFCKEVLKGYDERKQLLDLIIEHDMKLKCHDGTYQIDIYAEFKVMNVVFKVICECKHHSSPIKRDFVVLLDQKVKNIGAQKGILLSTCKFQSGSIQYAKAHGIALIEVFDNVFKYYSFANGDKLDKNDPFFYVATKYPYRAIDCTANSEITRNIYPTTMIEDALKDVDIIIQDLLQNDVN